VNVLGALAPVGPRPALVVESRLASEGKLDGAAFLDFVCRRLAGLPAGAAALEALPAWARRERPCTVVLDNYGVHHSKLVKLALPKLAAFGVAFSYLPAYSPKLNRIEPEWHALKYDRLAVRSFTSGPDLKAAVDAALKARAAELRNATSHLLEAA
jgi:transposase